MMFSKKPKILNEPDNIFKKLLDVVPQNLSRKGTRKYLKEFTLQELPEFEDVQADLFTREHCVPTNVLYVSYGTKNMAAKSTLNIGYPPSIWKKVSQAHRKQMFKKLDSVLDEKFAKGVNSDNVVYWQKGFTIIGKKLKTMKKKFKGTVYITIESFDTRVFPIEVVFETLSYKG
jgi:hypothetical protein